MTLEFASDDPRGFLSTYHDRTIIDEVQRVPELFSYIQTHIDKENRAGMYLLLVVTLGFMTSLSYLMNITRTMFRRMLNEM